MDASIETDANRKNFTSEKLRHFCSQHIWQGQLLREHVQFEQAEELPESVSSLVKFEKKVVFKYRRLCGILAPFVLWQLIWWCLAIHNGYFSLFKDGYKICITMIFGALVAGMTSEGGGAVAFPVMTLVLQISPTVARDFSLMIQSCGMTSAAFSLLWMKIHLEWHSIVYCSLGGSFGLIFGFEFVDPYLSAPVKKMLFVSIWFSFAVALFILNRKKDRITNPHILHFTYWQMVLLIGIGFLGGIFTSFSGSGIDICSFCFLTLLFCVSEKVATPTSVILMAINTVVGFFWRQLIAEQISDETWDYLLVCIPVVTLCAPLGSVVASHLHREVLAGLIYVLETMALIAAFAIVQPGWQLSLGSVAIIAFGCIGFWLLSRLGDRLRSFQQKKVQISVTNQEIDQSQEAMIA